MKAQNVAARGFFFKSFMVLVLDVLVLPPQLAQELEYHSVKLKLALRTRFWTIPDPRRRRPRWLLSISLVQTNLSFSSGGPS
jgi:hypothetical protein